MASIIPFEKALERLEQIVQDLEAGNVTLEDALKKYEEGVKLARMCQEKLVQAEKKIEVLTLAEDGTLKKENFSGEDELSGTHEDRTAGDGKKVKASTRKRGVENSAEEDLLI